MNSNRRIYWILVVLTIGSYAWIGYHFSTAHTESYSIGTVCFFKAITGIPCPSCGMTRAVLLFLQGEIIQSILTNPLGLLALCLLVAIPLWIGIDLFSNRYSLLNVFKHCEKRIQTQKIIYIPMIMLIAVNWIWNISKGI